MSDMPAWIQVFQGLLTPVIGAAVGGIAFMQWRTAHQKVVLDLFEKRLFVYNLLEEAAIEFELSPGRNDLPIRNAAEALSKGKFLFGADAFARIHQFFNAVKRFEPMPLEVALYDSEAERKNNIEKEHSAIMAEVKEFRRDMPNIFERYLRLDQKLIRTPAQWFLDRNITRLSYSDEKQK